VIYKAKAKIIKKINRFNNIQRLLIELFNKSNLNLGII
jgi:hypothetical protein